MSAARMRYVASICVIGAAMLASPSAFAAQCRSVGGHINGEQSSAVRTTSLKGSTLHLSGRMDGKPMPKRALDCMRIQIGLMCGAEFGPVSVSVMTRGKQMVETVTATDTGAELAGFSYECDRPVGR